MRDGGARMTVHTFPFAPPTWSFTTPCGFSYPEDWIVPVRLSGLSASYSLQPWCAKADAATRKTTVAQAKTFFLLLIPRCYTAACRARGGRGRTMCEGVVSGCDSEFRKAGIAA